MSHSSRVHLNFGIHTMVSHRQRKHIRYNVAYCGVLAEFEKSSDTVLEAGGCLGWMRISCSHIRLFCFKYFGLMAVSNYRK